MIYISGAGEDDSMVTTSERLGAIVMMAKPFEVDELVENVSLVLPPAQPADA